MSTPTLYPIEFVMERYGLSRRAVIRKCSSSVNAWPHLRPVESDAKTWRFSEEDIEAIEQRIRVREMAQDSWGRTTRKVAS